jgi:hypothetical protein
VLKSTYPGHCVFGLGTQKERKNLGESAGERENCSKANHQFSDVPYNTFFTRLDISIQV